MQTYDKNNKIYAKFYCFYRRFAYKKNTININATRNNIKYAQLLTNETALTFQLYAKICPVLVTEQIANTAIVHTCEQKTIDINIYNEELILRNNSNARDCTAKYVDNGDSEKIDEDIDLFRETCLDREIL